MQHVDSVSINFNPGQVLLLNICLGILMFGVALDLKFSDFRYVAGNLKSVLGGLVSQMILLPLLTLALVFIIKPEYSLAMGMILIAACPGGNVSNYAVHLSGANTALSVVLTMISTLICALTTPFIFSQLCLFINSEGSNHIELNIPFISMIETIILLIIVPLILGTLMVVLFPDFTGKVKGFIKKLSMLIFIGFVVAAVLGNIENLKNYLGAVFFIVLIHNGLALAVGYYWSDKVMRLPVSDSRAISIETGIQNSGLALILIFNYFGGLGGMALIAAWWSIWHLISAFVLALIWKKMV